MLRTVVFLQQMLTFSSLLIVLLLLTFACSLDADLWLCLPLLCLIVEVICSPVMGALFRLLA